MLSQVQKLISHTKDPIFIGEVFQFAKEHYKGRKRSSGESYFDHATNVALILGDLNLDQTTLAAGLLHDLADTHNPAEKQQIIGDITKKFGADIASIVEKSSQVNKIYYSTRTGLREPESLSEENVENIRKMFFAISGDLRVILIDLAARIDGLTKISHLPDNMQKSYATETLQIFAPIANRLGLGEIKAKLEDLAFSYLYPEKFSWLQENIKEKYEARQRYLEKLIPEIKKIFTKENISFSTIDYRAKSYWSTYQKLLTHDMDFGRIYDLVALRVIVEDVASCYKTLGIIHKYYKPVSYEKIKDYVAKPKINGYQSLHTTVVLEPANDTQEAKISEVQIRTEKMHQEAEHGICAYWSYKENIDLRKEKRKHDWIQKIPELEKTFNISFFSDRVFAFTPKGRVLMLPKGSTPVDFAYAVHSEIGNHCEAAKIDGKIIPLTQSLKNGDIVEIITNKKRSPSQDWLRFVKTSFAKSHIRKIITRIPVSIFSVPSLVTKKIFGISEKVRAYRKAKKKKQQEQLQLKQEAPKQLHLAGQKGIATTVAKCCKPKPEDSTKAYLTKYRAAVIHKISCENLQKLAKHFPEKVIETSWE